MGYRHYGGTPPHQRHSDTSRDAAERARLRIGPGHELILALLRDHDLTDEEMQEMGQMNPNTQRPRRRELQMDGQVRDSGVRRKTRSGSPAVVWTLTHGQREMFV